MSQTLQLLLSACHASYVLPQLNSSSLPCLTALCSGQVSAKLPSNKLLGFAEGSLCIYIGDVPAVTVSVAPEILATLLLNIDNPEQLYE